MDVGRPARADGERLVELVGRGGAQRMWRDPDAGVRGQRLGASRAAATSRVEHRQMGQADSGLGGGGEDALAQLGDVVVGRVPPGR